MHSVMCAHADLRIELLTMLLAAGPDPNEANERGNTPMHLVSYDSEVCDGSKLSDTEVDILNRTSGVASTSAWPLAGLGNGASGLVKAACRAQQWLLSACHAPSLTHWWTCI